MTSFVSLPSNKPLRKRGRACYDSEFVRRESVAVNHSMGKVYVKVHKRDTSPDAKVVINVGGRKFMTWKKTLRRFPHTLLGNDELSSQFYDNARKEFFIDRDPHFFRYILSYYQNGKLHRSIEDCYELFEEELLFYGIAPREINDCCFDEEHSDDEAHSEHSQESKNVPPPPSTRFGRFRRYIWDTLEGEVHSGVRASIGMIIVYFVGIFILLSIFTTVFETVECTSSVESCAERQRILDLIDIICIVIFTFEYLIRLSVCPSFLQFVKAPMNIIDLLSILPFFLTLLLQSLGTNLEAFVVLRVLRIFRVFKLSRHSKRLQRFGAAMISTLPDLSSLFFVLVVAVVIFSSMMYFIEVGAKEDAFISIPDSMWFTIVTMITLG